MNTESEELFDICIIGSGLAGLTAAHYIRKKTDKLRVAIIEGKNDVGGRVCPFNIRDEKYFTLDSGGEWFNKNQCFIHWLINDLNLTIDHQFNLGLNIWNFSFFIPSVSKALVEIMREEALSTKLNFGIISNFIWILSFVRLHQTINHVKNIIKKGLSVKAELYMNYLEGYSMASYISTSFFTKLLSKKRVQLMDATHRLLFGYESSQIPFLFYILYSQPPTSYIGPGIYNSLTGLTKNSQTYKIRGGAHAVCHKIRENLSNVTLSLGHCVTEIIEDRTDDSFRIKCSNGKQIKCKKIICAIPPNCLRSIKFLTCKPLSLDLRTTFEHNQPGRMIKFVLTYPTAFWRELGFTGQVVNCPQNSIPANKFKGEYWADLESKYSYFCCRRNKYVYRGPHVAPFDSIFDNTATVVDGETGQLSRPSLCGFIAADTYTFWAEKEEEERIVAITTYLNFVWKTCRAREFLQYYEKDWTRVELCGGAPVCVPSVGFTKFVLALREPHDNRIYFAGTETADFDMGTMSGAVQSGLRAGSACLSQEWPNLVSTYEADGMRNFGTGNLLEDKKMAHSNEPSSKINNTMLSKTAKVIKAIRLALTYAFTLNYGIVAYGDYCKQPSMLVL